MTGSALAQPADPTIQSFGPYALVAELGRGGTANVFLAVALADPGGSPVVLKVLRAYDEDHELRRMFANEGQLALRLRHPNVIRTFDAGREGKRPYLVMEHLRGRPLSKLLGPSGGVPLPLALRVLVEALEGLHYAHGLRDADGKPYGIVHRDVSPQNLFLTYEGEVKVLDFGAAKFADATAATAVGSIKGRLRYMAPEQAAGRPLDRRADVFSAGVVLWQFIADRPLWADLDDATVVSRLLRGDIPAPDAARDDVSGELLAACRRALAHDPARRFESAAAFAAALRAELERFGESGSKAALRDYLVARFAAEKERAERVVDVRLRQISTGLTPPTGVARPRPASPRAARPWELALAALATAVPAACLALLASLAWLHPHRLPEPPPRPVAPPADAALRAVLATTPAAPPSSLPAAPGPATATAARPTAASSPTAGPSALDAANAAHPPAAAAPSSPPAPSAQARDASPPTGAPAAASQSGSPAVAAPRPARPRR